MTRKCGHYRLRTVLVLVAFSVSAYGLQLTPDQRAAKHFERAGVLAKEHKLPEAEREYRAGLEIDPSSVTAYNNLGVIYFESGDFRRAADAFLQARRLRPGDADINFNLGLAFYKTGNCKDAIAPLAAGAASPQHMADAHYLLGACHYERKEWQTSIQELETARKAHPDDEKILFLLFNSYRNIGDRTQSLHAAAQLLESHPDSAFMYEMLGEAHDAAGQPREAEREFEHIPMRPNSISCWVTSIGGGGNTRRPSGRWRPRLASIQLLLRPISISAISP